MCPGSARLSLLSILYLCPSTLPTSDPSSLHTPLSPSILSPQTPAGPPAPCQQQHLGPAQAFAQELSHHLLDDEGAHEGIFICSEKGGWLQEGAWTESKASDCQVGRRKGSSWGLEGLPGAGARG